ncbi:hypothetical protein PoB_002091000 [Plakobranchus ocellatus]|uniref:Uncharacterized protein n=1 Tax=Plakobranchus ocellatus TaxID=259542 RepID=A0AAV3ZIK8_9GAST|nr:hypothetical protein PoB_002091000 [Plakobranchus ocellatus]
MTDHVLLPVERSNTSAQDTNDDVTSQPLTAKICDIPTGHSSPTATPSAYDFESPVSSGESEEHMTSFSPSDGLVSSTENHRVAQHINEIKRCRCEAADAQTSKAVKMGKGSHVDLQAGEQGENVAMLVPLVEMERRSW